MKVIDLLNKIAKGEEVPKHIILFSADWYWGYDTYTFKADLNNTPDNQHSLFQAYRLDYILNNEVEIIEDNKIEKLGEPIQSAYTIDEVRRAFNKIDELIDEVSKLKEEL